MALVYKTTGKGCFFKPNHGMTHSQLFKIWREIKYRCIKKYHPSYKLYGGAGVKIYKKWMEFIPFQEWAHENGYEIGKELVRKDKNYHYCPDNCEWR